jgi:hypothetical protein
MGDLNTGIRVNKGETARKAERNWDIVQKAGWDCPGERTEPFICSLCADNRLRGYTGNDRLIDHVLVRNQPGKPTLIPACVGRILTGPVTVEGYDGTPVQTPVSDHYGIVAKFLIR